MNASLLQSQHTFCGALFAEHPFQHVLGEAGEGVVAGRKHREGAVGAQQCENFRRVQHLYELRELSALTEHHVRNVAEQVKRL